MPYILLTAAVICAAVTSYIIIFTARNRRGPQRHDNAASRTTHATLESLFLNSFKDLCRDIDTRAVKRGELYYCLEQYFHENGIELFGKDGSASQRRQTVKEEAIREELDDVDFDLLEFSTPPLSELRYDPPCKDERDSFIISLMDMAWELSILGYRQTDPNHTFSVSYRKIRPMINYYIFGERLHGKAQDGGDRISLTDRDMTPSERIFRCSELLAMLITLSLGIACSSLGKEACDIGVISPYLGKWRATAAR
jgi:hypothetical protein